MEKDNLKIALTILMELAYDNLAVLNYMTVITDGPKGRGVSDFDKVMFYSDRGFFKPTDILSLFQKLEEADVFFQVESYHDKPVVTLL